MIQLAYKPVQFQEEPEPILNQWKPSSLGGGLCLKDLEQSLLDDQSPRLLNVWYLDRILSKRYGQEMVLANNLTDKIYAVYEKEYNGKIVFHCGTKLYFLADTVSSTWADGLWADAVWGVPVEIYSGLTAQKGTFFADGDNLYYKNGAEYVMYNNTTCVVTVPYIPTTFTACPPTGGGTALEDENRYGAGQTNRFSSTGGATFQLSKTNLDATLLTAIVGGVAKAETTDFTVNRTTGLVTFGSVVTAGTNNVDITFYKTNSSIISAFNACKYAFTYGDAKERIFFGGNNKADIYWSDVNLPHYIPLSNTKKMGDSGEDVTGFGIQNDTLCVFKPKTIYSCNKVTGTTLVDFAFAFINNSIGCDMPYTIQLINNRLVWANTYGGAFTLTSTLIQDERNIKPISENINGTLFRQGLLNEPLANLQAATSCDWTKNGQYWLCVGENVYMWDYGLRPYNDTGNLLEDQKRLSWWKFDNINANCFYINGGDMYYGDRTIGNFAHMIDQFNDFGAAINSYYRIPLRDFGINNWFKTVPEITITTRADTKCYVSIEYINERDSRVDPQPIALNSFSWAYFSWAVFTWAVINFGKAFTRYPNSKHVLYWSVEFSNNLVDRDMSIIDIVVNWFASKKNR